MLLNIRRALISVSDKMVLEEIAHSLISHGVEILASGGTAKALKKAGITFRDVEEFTGNPEAFDGRMKTISFKLESAILFDRTNPSHLEQARNLNIEPIDCVICNFYPFEDALSKELTEDQLIEYIDVGGPTMVRSAAKNFKSVLVVVDPSDYSDIIAELRKFSGGISLETRKAMMIKAFEKMSSYDQAIFESFGRKNLRYGENPHQQGFFVKESIPSDIDWKLVEPGEAQLSYNNILDANTAYLAMKDTQSLAHPGHGACAIVKHGNPCGLATAPTLEVAFERAWQGDPVSSFGGVVSFSSPLTFECARLLDEKFVEVLLAPGFEDGAIDFLRRKKKKLRILKTKPKSFSPESGRFRYQRTTVEGGYLVQNPDESKNEEFRTVTKKKFPKDKESAGRFGIVAAKWIKSNAIALVRSLSDGGVQLIGMGSGQPNRVDAIRRLAIPKAIEVTGCQEGLADVILVSDAFFPFADSIEEAAKFGIKYFVQPGGSVRDSEVIAACDELGVAMAFTGKRHFRH